MCWKSIQTGASVLQHTHLLKNTPLVSSNTYFEFILTASSTVSLLQLPLRSSIIFHRTFIPFLTTSNPRFFPIFSCPSRTTCGLFDDCHYFRLHTEDSDYLEPSFHQAHNKSVQIYNMYLLHFIQRIYDVKWNYNMIFSDECYVQMECIPNICCQLPMTEADSHWICYTPTLFSYRW